MHGADPHSLSASPAGAPGIDVWWYADKFVPDTDDDTNGAATDGSCTLPPNTHFTVSGIGNSLEKHAVVIDIEDIDAAQAHPGIHVEPVGKFGTMNMAWPKTGSSGKVKVSVGLAKPDDLDPVTKIDNPLKLVGQQMTLPNGTHLFVIAANDGAETGRNDCIVTLTWPIEKPQ